MSFIAFHTAFPELGLAELRSVITPEGSFAFMELYCDEPDCDCRRVMFHLVGSDGTFEATLNYGWESLDFYRRWLRGSGDEQEARDLQGPGLQPLARQGRDTDRALVLLRIVLADPAYIERLKRHYAMFRDTIAPGLDRASRASTEGMNRVQRRALRRSGRGA